MKIQIVEGKEKPEIIIKCQKVDCEINRLIWHIQMFERKIQAKNGDEVCLVNLSDILYFEAVDNRIFLYTEDEVMEMKQRLYELETLLPEEDFIRTSKSQIINIGKIKSLRPELNRTILATMCNGEKLSISRKYVPVVKRLLSV